MTNAVIPTGGNASPHLTPEKALKLAWLCWGILLAGPFLLLQVLIWCIDPQNQSIVKYLSSHEFARFHPTPEGWFIVAMAYLAVILPLSFFWRGHLFKDYWLGHPIAPRKYILATISIGIALAFGGILSLAGCLVTNSFMPNLIPGLFALLLFVLHWPKGTAMVRSFGNKEDPEVYEEPR